MKQVVAVSPGTWHDLTTLLGLLTETHREGNLRWYGTVHPQYMAAFVHGKPAAVRLLGTALVLVPGEEGVL